jgi:hypothetical protein
VAPNQPEVLRSRLPPPAVPRQLSRGNIELPRHEGDDRLGCGAQVIGAEAQEIAFSQVYGYYEFRERGQEDLRFGSWTAWGAR